MKKYLNISAVVLGCFMFLFFSSCGDDNDDSEVSQEWINHQNNWVEKVKEAVRDGIFTQIKSESGYGYVYTRPSDFITNNMAGDFDKDGPEALPETRSVRAVDRPIFETDSVRLRYEAWYYNLKDKKVIFSSTESDPYGNNAKIVSFVVNGVSNITSIKNSPLNIDGVKTALLDMKVGEERIVCIPYKLGTGVYGISKIGINGYPISLSGYTTLFFDVKILRNVTAEEEAGM